MIYDCPFQVEMGDTMKAPNSLHSKKKMESIRVEIKKWSERANSKQGIKGKVTECRVHNATDVKLKEDNHITLKILYSVSFPFVAIHNIKLFQHAVFICIFTRPQYTQCSIPHNWFHCHTDLTQTHSRWSCAEKNRKIYPKVFHVHRIPDLCKWYGLIWHYGKNANLFYCERIYIRLRLQSAAG